MTFIELIANIEATGEKVFADRTFEILTTTKRYVNVNGDWQQDVKTEGVLRSKMGRSGETFFWGPKIDPAIEVPSVIPHITKKVKQDHSKIIDKLREFGVDSIDDPPKKPTKVPCNAIGVKRSCLMGTAGCSITHQV